MIWYIIHDTTAVNGTNESLWGTNTEAWSELGKIRVKTLNAHSALPAREKREIRRMLVKMQLMFRAFYVKV